MADTYTSFGKFLLLKQRAQDGLGTLWRAGEMDRNSFKRIVWLRRFDQVGLDRAALAAEIGAANQIAQVLKATNVVRNAVYATEGGVSYIAWDYVPAQPLDQVMARRPPWVGWIDEDGQVSNSPQYQGVDEKGS